MLENYQDQDSISQEIRTGVHYLLILLDGKPAGYTAYEEKEGKIYLSKIYLDMAFRGRGLMTKVLNWYQTLAPGRSIFLFVNKENKQAISVYEHWGFKRIGERTLDIGQGFFMDDYLFELEA